MTPAAPPALLEARAVRAGYRAQSGHTAMVLHDVDLRVGEAEMVGLVGESGCGKTTLGNVFAGLVALSAGEVRFRGNLLRAPGMPRSRRSEVQMVFQDPNSSLNPRHTVGGILSEVLRVRGMPPMLISRGVARPEAGAAVLLDAVGLPAACSSSYPHELSGGQRQRVGLARALAAGPQLIVADEPVSALDVSVQAQILNLVGALRDEFRVAFLLVAHDLAVVEYLCDRIYVMYAGRIVEHGPARRVLASPAHPYTEALLSAVPDVDRGLTERSRGNAAKAARHAWKGEAVEPSVSDDGCPARNRCHRAEARCASETPPLLEVVTARSSACHFAAEILAGNACEVNHPASGDVNP